MHKLSSCVPIEILDKRAQKRTEEARGELILRRLEGRTKDVAKQKRVDSYVNQCESLRRLSMERLSMGKSSAKDALLPGTLEMLVLKTLTRAPLHGYGIAQYIRQVSDEVLQVEEGSLYPALQRLQIKGWVTSEWALTENNRRARYYRLTPLGREQLAAERASYDRLIDAIARVMEPA